MKVEIINPAEELKSIIKSYTIIETTLPMETTVLPHLGLVIAIQYKGNVLLCNNDKSEPISALTVSGIRNNYRKFFYKANTGTILISFTEAGALSLFGKTVFDLFGITEPLENLFKSSLVFELQEQITFAKSNQDRIKLIEKFIISARKVSKPDKLVLNAITEIQSSKGINRIKDLSKQLNISQDAFEKRFRNIVGSTPKQYSTIVRMKSIVKSQKENKSLSELTYHFEFYDQSHFIKQFKDFAGQTPKDFFKTSYNW